MKSAWRGEYPLWVSFWLFYVLGWLAATILGGMVIFLFRRIGLLGFGWGIAGVGWLLWQMFSAVAVWNSARRQARSPIWFDRISDA